MVITEVGRMGVKPGLNVMDNTTREGQLLTHIWKAIAAAPTGPHRIYWGLGIEDPSKLWVFFDWDSVAQHVAFAKEFGAEMVKDLPTIMSYGEFTKHVAVTPSSPAVVQSPMTQIVLAYFRSDVSLAEKDAATTRLQEFLGKSFGTCVDVKGMSVGWGVENDFPVIGGEKDQKGSVLMAFIGWGSVEASTKYRDLEDYKMNVEVFKGVEGLLKLTTVHIKCESVGKKIDKTTESATS